MGSGGSKPPPQRTSVRRYPGSIKTTTTDDATSSNGQNFKTPRSLSVADDTLQADGQVEAEGIKRAPETPPPTIVSEEIILGRSTDDRDVIIDDGEPVTGKPKAEVTQKKRNAQVTELGRKVSRLDCRKSQADDKDSGAGRPEVPSGSLWVDPDFPQPVAMAKITDKVRWMRPKEFLEKPCLYDDGTCRFDIEQGAVGTCWLLSVLQALADQPDFIKWLIPENSYRIGSDDYDGVFHCRFWRFGSWVDVYVDDFIPVHESGNFPWGARSKTDPNELWVTLIEKAFAKYHGSYHGCTGGLASQAFMSLTGGTAEVLDLADLQPKVFYKRVKNSLTCGSIVACSGLGGAESMGIVGSHSYSMTAVSKVLYRSKFLPLVRLRNPWGNMKGEWTGAWSDGSPQWKELAPSDRDALSGGGADGEFWMSLTDFYQYFGDVCICNYTPDVDQDGITDDMDKVWVISGEWDGEQAASYKQKMKNPIFQFEIPKDGINRNSVTPVAVQFIQSRKDRKSTENLLNIRCDLYKVGASVDDGGSACRLVEELTNFTSYWGGESLMYRYPQLATGKYILVPHYSQDPGQEKEFLLRIFTQKSIECSEVPESSGFFIHSLETDVQAFKTTEVDTHFGKWVAGKNAGGQISNRSVGTNPQYQVAIRGTGPQNPCSISLCQERDATTVPIGFALYKKKQAPLPVTTDWLYSNQNECIKTIDGSHGSFVAGPEAKAKYVLGIGDYILLLHTNNADEEARYFLQVATKQKIPCREFNVCK